MRMARVSTLDVQAGTGGNGPLLYRTRKQASAIDAACPRRAAAARRSHGNRLRTRAADVAAVKALP
jgi:hypothetical protein